MARPLQERAVLRGGFRGGSDFLTSIPVHSIVRSPGGSYAVERTPPPHMMSPRSWRKANSSRDLKATRRFSKSKELIREHTSATRMLIGQFLPSRLFRRCGHV